MLQKVDQKSKSKKLAIMDQDGANTKYLTLGNELVLTPRFNPTNQMVTYMSYFRNMPRVYLLDIETGTQEVVGNFPGMTFAPRFSPDGKKIVMSFAKDGNSDIYTMDLEQELLKELQIILQLIHLLHFHLMENLLHLILIEVVYNKFML